MTLTSDLLILIMIMIWKTPIIFIILYIMMIRLAELIYLNSVLYKFDQGGYLPLAFSALLITIMLVSNYVYRKRYTYELVDKVSNERVEEIILNPNIHRILQIAFFYSELVQGIPPIFEHYVRNVPALHSVLIFVSIRLLPISRVPHDEQFLFRRVGSHNCFVFLCVARYGYKDARSEHEPFDAVLVPRLKEFMESSRALENGNGEGEVTMGQELKLVKRERKNGVVQLLGKNEVVAGRWSRSSSLWKKFVINCAYGILKRNIRQQDEVYHSQGIGMTVEL